jgi:hypothetical protein
MTDEADKVFAKLELEGEDSVRKKLASERVYGAFKRELVVEWLRRKDQDREESSNREHMEIARSAAAAARDTALEARKANRIATAAIIIAIASMAVSIAV